MLALAGAVLFLIAAIIDLLQDPIQLNVVLKLVGFVLLALVLGGIGYTWSRLDVLALVAALLFLIALILEFTSYPATADILLTTAGFILVSLFLAGVGPRTLRRV